MTRLLTSLAWVASVALTACATTAAPAHPTLQGEWRLDAAASDDAATRIAHAIRIAQARLRKDPRYAGTPGGPGDGGGGGVGSGPDDQGDLGELGVGAAPLAPDFHTLRELLQQELDTPHTLTFKSEAADVVIQADGLPGRDYQPGSTLTLFDEYGTSQIKTSWKDDTFLITKRYTSGARLQERYSVDARGALEYSRSLRDPAVGKIELKSVYRRAAP